MHERNITLKYETDVLDLIQDMSIYNKEFLFLYARTIKFLISECDSEKEIYVKTKIECSKNSRRNR